MARTIDTTIPDPSKNQGGIAVVDVAIPVNMQIATRHNALGEGTGLGIGKDGDPAFTLQAAHSHAVCAGFVAGQGAKAGGIGYQEEVSPTLKSVNSGTNAVPSVVVAPFDTTQITSRQNASKVEYGAPCHTLNANAHVPSVVYGFSPDNSVTAAGTTMQEECAPTLSTTKRTGVAFAATRHAEYHEGVGTLRRSGGDVGLGSETLIASIDCRNSAENPDLCGTLQAKSNGGYSLNYTHPVRIGYTARRLTPLECCRLMGFPDWWCEGIPHSDSAEYRMWGNGMALPCVMYVMENVAAVLNERRIVCLPS